MKGRLPASGDSRGVSDIVGVVILISMAIAGALLVVAVGGMALSDINAQTNDDLAHDSFREVDSRLSDLSDSSVDSTTSFNFPESVGNDVTARPSNGTVRISVNATASDSVIEDDDGACSISSTLGTIQYENRDGTLVAYQGGGLWRQTSGETLVESNPGLDYNGNNIDLSFVDISTLGAISEGSQVTASKNVSGSQQRTEQIQQQLSPCWTLNDSAGTVPVEITITVESQFADGWAKYARNDMLQPLDSSDISTGGEYLNEPDVSLEDVRENRRVTFHLGTVGNVSKIISTPSDFEDKVFYTGLSQYAKFNSEIYPTGNAPNDVVVDRAAGSYAFGLYHPEYGWLVYDKNNNEEWVAKNAPKHPSVNESNLPVNTSAISDVPDGARTNASNANKTFNLEENAAVCVAENSGQVSNENCNVSMIGLNDPDDLHDDTPHYEVNITGTNSPMTEGDQLNVTVKITNTGNADGDKYVLLGDFNNTLVNYRTVQVDENATKLVTLPWNTAYGDAGTGDVIVEPEGGDSWATESVTIENFSTKTPQYEVTINGTNSSVDEGETLRVDATVENTGNASGTQWVVLEDFAGNPVDAREVNLSVGESTPTTLYWDTGNGDAGTSHVTVASEYEDATEQVTVNSSDAESPEFEVDLDSKNSPVDEGETLSVTATVENTGNEAGTQWVVLEDFDGNPVDAQNVTNLAVGDTTPVTLGWETAKGDANTANVTIASEDDIHNEEVTVEAVNGTGPELGVDITATDSPVDEGETLGVTVEVENTGESGTEWVVLEDFAGNPVDAQKVSVSGGDTTPVTLNWKTAMGDAGTGALAVSTPADNDTQNVTVTGVSGPEEGLVYVGPIGSSGAQEYLLTGNITVDTTYQRVDVTGGSACTEFPNTKYGDSGTDIVCDESPNPPHSGYILDMHYSNDDYEDYRMYVADTEDGEWDAANPISAADDKASLVHSEDVGAISNTSKFGDVGTFYEVADDTPVCIVEDGASINPDEDCGPILENVTGNMDYDDGKNVLEVNATDANLSLLTAQVGQAIEEEKDVRLPMDVFFVLDESGSMMATDLADSGTAFPGTYEVPEDTVYELDDDVSHDDYYLPGEIMEVTEYRTVYVWDDVGNDPYGQRITATKSFIGGLNETLDRAGATQFDYEDTRLSPLDHDLDAVNQTLQTDAGGGTNISAGIYDAIDGLTDSSGSNKRVMVVLSDGVHNLGSPYPEDAAEAAAEENITIYTVGLGDGVDTDQLETVAQKTNGSYYPVADASQLKGVFDEIVEKTKTNRVIERDRTTVTAVTDSGMSKSVEIADSSNLNDPNYFNSSGSDTIATQLENGLNDSDLSFEMTVYSCKNYNSTGVSSTKDGETYVHTTCAEYDTDSGTTIDNDDVQDHIIITEDNTNELSDIDQSEWWQPEPSSLGAMDPYTDGTDVNLTDNEAIIGLEVDAGSQTGYVLLHFEVNQTSDVRDDWEGDTTEDRANFTVDITGTDSPVTEGENLTVNAQIENVGDANGTQYVLLRNPDGHVVDTKGVALDKGGTETVTMEWSTAPGDAGSGTVTIATRDDSDNAAVDIQPKPDQRGNFEVDITITNSSIVEGEALEVTANIENTNNATGTQDVVLEDFDGSAVASENVTLTDGNSKTISLTWETTTGDADTADVTVATRDDDATEEVTVKSAGTDQSNFTVDITHADSPVTEGDALTIDANIENVGNATGTEYVMVRAGGDVVTSKAVTLASGVSSNETLTWVTRPGDASVSSVTVVTQEDTETASVNVTAKNSPDTPAFTILNSNATSPVTEGDTVSVEATIENTASVHVGQLVALEDPDGDRVDVVNVALNSGTSTDVSLSWTVPLGTTDGTSSVTKDLTIDAVDDSKDVSVTIEPLATDGSSVAVGDIGFSPIEVDVTKIELES